MKKEILEALIAQFPGVQAAVLDRIASKLAKTVTTSEQVKPAVEGVTIQQVIESYTDSRVTEASETARKKAVQDYETRHGLKDGIKADTGGESKEEEPERKHGDETPAWAKALMERMDRMEGAKITDTRKQQLSAVISKLPEPMRKAYERIPLDKYSDEEFASALSEITSEVEGIENDTATKGAIFGRPTNTGAEQKKEELSDAQKAAISHRDGGQSADGQPF